MRLALAAILIGLSACAAPNGRSGQFNGSAIPATPGPLCATTHASLRIRDTVVIFAPDDGTWILEGLIAPDNSIAADKSRIAPNNQVYDTTFQGRLTGDVIDGTYKTPRCSSTVHLTRR